VAGLVAVVMVAMAGVAWRFWPPVQR